VTIKDPVDKVFFDFHDGKGEVETSLEAVAAHIDRPVYELEAMVCEIRDAGRRESRAGKHNDAAEAVRRLTASEIRGRSICAFLSAVDHTALYDLDLSIEELQKRYMEIFYQGSDHEDALRYAIYNGCDGEYSQSWLDAVVLYGSRPDAPFYTKEEWNSILKTGKPVYEDQIRLTPEETEAFRNLVVSRRLSPGQAAFLFKRILKTEEKS